MDIEMKKNLPKKTINETKTVDGDKYDDSFDNDTEPLMAKPIANDQKESTNGNDYDDSFDDDEAIAEDLKQNDKPSNKSENSSQKQDEKLKIKVKHSDEVPRKFISTLNDLRV
jgi:hypothetical protein